MSVTPSSHYESPNMSQHKLSYIHSAPLFPPSEPKGIERTYIPTPSGALELLYSKPTPAKPLRPILFQHGGFGSAACYENYLPWFAERGYPSYSLSLRGHGNSWYLSYWSMYFTPKEAFATDLAAAIDYVASKHGNTPILFGHSAGGGLSQITLNMGLSRVYALGLIGAFPNFGGFRVYMNWFLKVDIWSFPRIFKDLMHPRSPLSSTDLVHRAFFSSSFPTNEVQRFEAGMPEYESMLWPSQMLGRIVDVENVKRGTETRKVLIVSGEDDVLMTRDLMERMAVEYGGTIAMVRGGHNVMRDQYWEESAVQILQWIQSLDK